MVLTCHVAEIEVCISVSISHHLGAAMRSLETYTDVISMPGLHLITYYNTLYGE